MKFLKKQLTIFFLVAGMLCLSLSRPALGIESPIRFLNLSLWSEYTNNHFNGLSQDQKTAKLQQIFADKLEFIHTHQLRRLIVKILDPLAFEFFHPQTWDPNRDDNFYYWALQLSQIVEIEVLFDKEPFSFSSESHIEALQRYFDRFYREFQTSAPPFGEFKDIINKLSWVTQINQVHQHLHEKGWVIRGIVIDPQGSGALDPIYQNLINILDQYKYNGSEELPENCFEGLRTALLLKPDEKNLILANLARFPINSDLKGTRPYPCGITPPSTFPSKKPNYPPPQWRQEQRAPLLDTIYLQMYDERLIDPLYQNQEILPLPSKYSPAALRKLHQTLAKNFQGIPFVKGPGVITSSQGTSSVRGTYTFFKTGSPKKGEGKLVEGQVIQIDPPYVKNSVQKVIAQAPKNNKTLSFTSPVSPTDPITNAEYLCTPLPVVWETPLISHFIIDHIYYVFSSAFDLKGNRYMGNWHLQNFIHFLHNPFERTGFLFEPLYTDFSNAPITPTQNIVLYDYSTIPNGEPYPEFNWNLGNHTY